MKKLALLTMLLPSVVFAESGITEELTLCDNSVNVLELLAGLPPDKEEDLKLAITRVDGVKSQIQAININAVLYIYVVDISEQGTRKVCLLSHALNNKMMKGE